MSFLLLCQYSSGLFVFNVNFSIVYSSDSLIGRLIKSLLSRCLAKKISPMVIANVRTAIEIATLMLIS